METTILSKDHIERIQLAQADFKGSANELEAECKLLIRPGTVLYWRTRGYLQSGIVINFIGTAHYPDIRVENIKTGKIVDVDLYYVDWDWMIGEANVYAKEFKQLEGEANL